MQIVHTFNPMTNELAIVIQQLNDDFLDVKLGEPGFDDFGYWYSGGYPGGAAPDNWQDEIEIGNNQEFTLRVSAESYIRTSFRIYSDAIEGQTIEGYPDEWAQYGYIYGSNYADVVGGGHGNDFLFGYGGDDLIKGTAGADQIDGGDGTDTMSYETIDNVGIVASLQDQSFNTGWAAGDVYTSIENLTGTRFADTLHGDGAANVIDGGLGVDVMHGGGGNDTYRVDRLTDEVHEAVGGGFDEVIASVSYALLAGSEVEKLRTSNAAVTTAINLAGNDFANMMEGNAGANRLDGRGGDDELHGFGGNDILTGGLGADQLFGGDGVDYAFYGNATAGVTARLSGLNGTGEAAGDTFSGIEGFRGSDFVDTFFGANGANVLDGGGGADALHGLAGDDTYYVDNALDTVHEAADGGNDRVIASANFALGAGSRVEILQTIDHTATTALNLTGNEFANTIAGNAGANVLDGKEGIDRLYGYGGSDTYRVDHASDRVYETAGNGTDRVIASVSYVLSAGAEVEILQTIDHAATTAINLTGNEFASTIAGNAAANILDGKGGTDRLYGYGGNDTYYVDNASDRVYETAGGGTDRVIASTSYALSKTSDVEILQTINHTATTALNLTGNEFANTVAGNAGANILDGKGGVDRLHGYGGNDTYYVDNASDRVYETTGNGIDRVIASVSYALAAGTEVEILQTANAAATTAINLTGNEFANTLIGNAGINILTGRDGSDTYHVGNAADQVIEGLTGDTDRVTTSVGYTLAQGCEVEILQAVSHTATTAMNLTGNEFDNTVAGTAGANTLRGEGGGDKLYGYDGNDRLYGGDGNDSLYGGEGNDTFVFDRAPSATNRDAIADLDVIDDTIWLDDAAFSAAGPVGFLVSEAFYAGPAAHDASDRILYDITNGRLYYDADGTGSGAATLIAYLDAGLNVTASDFQVV